MNRGTVLASCIRCGRTCFASILDTSPSCEVCNVRAGADARIAALEAELAQARQESAQRGELLREWLEIVDVYHYPDLEDRTRAALGEGE